MDPDKLLSYFRYLRGKIDILLSSSVVGIQEIAPLQSELRLFRERVSALHFQDPKLHEHLISVNLSIAPVHLAGSKEHFSKNWWRNLPWMGYFRSTRQAKDKEVIDAELSKLRDNLYDLYRLAEATFKSI